MKSKEITEDEKSVFLKVMGDYPINRVLDFLTVFDEFDYSLTEIAKNAKISYSTLQLFWANLEKNGIVKLSRVVGKAKLYKLNRPNPAVKEFLDMYWTLTDSITNKQEEAIIA